MAQTLEDFILKIGNYGISKNNKFEILLPKHLDSVNNGFAAELSDTNSLAKFYAESVTIPGKVINTIKTRIQGKNIERPYEFLYDGQLSMTFLIDTRLQIRKYFEDWINLVLPNGDETSFSPNLPSIYKHTMQVIVVDNIMSGAVPTATTGIANPLTTFIDAAKKSFESGGVSSATKAATKEVDVGIYTFFDVYPKYVSGFTNSNAGREFHKMKVDFEFDYMTSEHNEKNPNIQARPALNKGTGTGILGSINGLADSAGKSIGGTGGQIANSGSKLSGILGL